METLPWFHTQLGYPEDIAGYHTISPHGRGGVQGAYVGSPVNLPSGVETPVYQQHILCDTFFSSIPSVRGFTCWTQYSLLCSDLDWVYLMQRWSQYLPTLQRMLVDCGVPHTTHSDNAPEFKLEIWTKLTKTYLIKNTYTEAYHPNQNPCEHRSSVLKAATSHHFLVTGAPSIFCVTPWSILYYSNQILPIGI